MKTLLTTVALVMVTGMASAATVDQDNVLGSNVNTVNESGSIGTQNQAGSGDTNTSSTTVESFKPNGYVASTALTTSGSDTCYGSTTGGFSAAGIGISGGKTVVDENCQMIKNARLLVQIGLKDAATVLLMNSNADIANAIWMANPELAEMLTAVEQ